MKAFNGLALQGLVLAVTAACLVLVALVVNGTILSEADGAKSAGPVPSAAPILRARPGQQGSIDTGASKKPGVPEVDYTIDLTTGAMTPLPDAITRRWVSGSGVNEGFLRYAASRDGSMLAYVGIGDEGSLQVFTAGVDGTEVRQVTHDPRGAVSPAWSPDGTRIAYTGYGSGEVRNLFVLDVVSSATTQVTDGTHDLWDSQFSPDGASLVYTGGTSQVPLLMTVPVAGGKSTLLIGPSEAVTDAGNGSLSPDGSLVTFLGGGWPKEGTGHCGPCRFVAKADGTERRVIRGCFGSNPAGTWSPDGSRIVCTTNTESGVFSVMVADIATGKASRVAKGNGAIWLDRHTLLVEVS